MAKAIALRGDYTAAQMRNLAKNSRDADQTRRLLALAAIYEGNSRSEAAKIGGVTLQIVRDWVTRFNDKGPDGLINGKAPGKRPLLNAEQRAALARAVEAGPKPYVDGVVRWRLVDLVQWVWEEFGLSVSRQTLGRELRGMGYRKLSARPHHHRQDKDAMEDFKKIPCPRGRDRSGASVRSQDRGVVLRRGPGGPEDPSHPTVGPPGYAATGSGRSAHALGLHLWSDLPGPGNRRGPDHAPLQHPRHGAAPRGNLSSRRAGQPCHCDL